MGVSTSSTTKICELQGNHYLKRFAGEEELVINDPFWNQFLSFTMHHPVDKASYNDLRCCVLPHLESLVGNSCGQSNFQNLLKTLIVRGDQLFEMHLESIGDSSIEEQSAYLGPSIFLRQVCNALLILRVCLAHLIEQTITEELYTWFQEDRCDSSGVVDYFEELFNFLCKSISYIPVNECTYNFHLQSVLTILTILGSDLYRQDDCTNPFIEKMLSENCTTYAPVLIRRLIVNFMYELVTPTDLIPLNSSNNSSTSGYLYDATASLATGLLNIVTFGYAGRSEETNEAEDLSPVDNEVSHHLLMNHSILLVLLLSNQRLTNNPYRDTVAALMDINGSSNGDSLSESSPHPHHLIDFQTLHATILRQFDRQPECASILLYQLVHCNTYYRTFVLNRCEIMQTIIPLLKIIYQSSQHSEDPPSFYMALIVLLILSENNEFSHYIHGEIVHDTTWLVEHQFKSVSLGSLMVFVLIRAISCNLHDLKNQYLHKNCLAALSNLSPKLHQLHSYSCQKWLTLMLTLSRKHCKLIKKIEEETVALKSLGSESHTLSEEIASSLNVNSCIEELGILEEVIRTLFEALNAAVTHCLTSNPHLIYSLLHQREVFTNFRSHPAFQEILQNMDQILSLFSAHITADCTTESSVLTIIKSQAATISKNHSFKKLPEPLFQYVEEENPEHFFLPCIWSQIIHHSPTLVNFHLN